MADLANDSGNSERAPVQQSCAPVGIDVPDSTPSSELAPNGDAAGTVRDVVAALDAAAERDARGRFIGAATPTLTTGTRSAQLRNALAPAQRAIVAQVNTDLGGDADGLPATLQRLVGAFAETTLLRESVFIRMAGQPTTNKGHARRMLAAYLQLVDRELRLATAIGLERKAKRAPSLAEYLRTRQQSATATEGTER